MKIRKSPLCQKKESKKKTKKLRKDPSRFFLATEETQTDQTAVVDGSRRSKSRTNSTESSEDDSSDSMRKKDKRTGVKDAASKPRKPKLKLGISYSARQHGSGRSQNRISKSLRSVKKRSRRSDRSMKSPARKRKMLELRKKMIEFKKLKQSRPKETTNAMRNKQKDDLDAKEVCHDDSTPRDDSSNDSTETPEKFGKHRSANEAQRTSQVDTLPIPDDDDKLVQTRYDNPSNMLSAEPEAKQIPSAPSGQTIGRTLQEETKTGEGKEQSNAVALNHPKPMQESNQKISTPVLTPTRIQQSAVVESRVKLPSPMKQTMNVAPPGESVDRPKAKQDVIVTPQGLPVDQAKVAKDANVTAGVKSTDHLKAKQVTNQSTPADQVKAVKTANMVSQNARTGQVRPGKTENVIPQLKTQPKAGQVTNVIPQNVPDHAKLQQVKKLTLASAPMNLVNELKVANVTPPATPRNQGKAMQVAKIGPRITPIDHAKVQQTRKEVQRSEPANQVKALKVVNEIQNPTPMHKPKAGKATDLIRQVGAPRMKPTPNLRILSPNQLQTKQTTNVPQHAAIPNQMQVGLTLNMRPSFSSRTSGRNSRTLYFTMKKRI
ncbi:hypothetical protein AB6A40_008431 [Gnathostoma spinigerum]|uniref:Uncharacterized protein n=1 Tax=Gnathostoma spinigerum TaxID=75299 RepID=A0ABD6EYE8_9BILA